MRRPPDIAPIDFHPMHPTRIPWSPRWHGNRETAPFFSGGPFRGGPHGERAMERVLDEETCFGVRIQTIQTSFQSSAASCARSDVPEEALEFFQRYHNHVPGDFQGVAQIGSCLSDLGRYSEAEPYLRRALEGGPDALTHYNLGTLLSRARSIRGSGRRVQACHRSRRLERRMHAATWQWFSWSRAAGASGSRAHADSGHRSGQCRRTNKSRAGARGTGRAWTAQPP